VGVVGCVGCAEGYEGAGIQLVWFVFGSEAVGWVDLDWTAG